jgi:hypothetical protein
LLDQEYVFKWRDEVTAAEFQEMAIRWLQAKEAYPWMDHSESLDSLFENAYGAFPDSMLRVKSVRECAQAEFSAIEREFGRSEKEKV